MPTGLICITQTGGSLATRDLQIALPSLFRGAKEAKRYRAPRLRRGPQSRILTLLLVQGGE